MGDTCTVRQDAFARAWAETGNQAAAYRMAYRVQENTAPNTVWSNASRIAAIPAVRKKADEYRQQITLELIVTVRDALQWQLDIATADPNELVSVAIRCCRYCHGVNHKYQWIDEDEYLSACIKAIDEEGQESPTDEGGYGYARALEPTSDCPACLGVGIHETIIRDTTKLTGKARKLYKGAKQDRFGAVEVFTHDQKAAWEMVCRMLGAFNDKLQLLDPNKAPVKLPEGLSEQDTARAYLSMLGSAT